MMQKAAWPGRRPLASLVFVLCACTSTTAESAGDVVRMMRKEDASNSAPEPSAVPSISSVRGVQKHNQEQLGSDLAQKKDISASASQDDSRTRNSTEASKMHVSHSANVLITPMKEHKEVIKDVTIPGKVIGAPGKTSTAAPQIVPYAGQQLSDPGPPDSQPDTSKPRPPMLTTAERLRQERSAAEKAGGKIGGNIPKLVKAMVPPKPRVISHAGFSQIHRSDEGFQGMAQAARELILEEELEKAEKQQHAALAAGIIDPPHATEPEEDGDKHDQNDDDDEEDRRRFPFHSATKPAAKT